MRRISEVSGIARNSLGLIAKGQITVRQIIVENVIQGMTTLDQVASDQAELNKLGRETIKKYI
jgi:hypothetical protein